MKLRNKKTGEIIDVYKGQVLLHYNNGRKTIHFKSLEELEEWEGYKEDKNSALDVLILTLTNFIENEADEDKVDLEDCKQMLDKLKAWKRLKDKGFSFGGWEDCNGEINTIYFSIPENKWETDTCDDLDICFGGEE